LPAVEIGLQTSRQLYQESLLQVEKSLRSSKRGGYGQA